MKYLHRFLLLLLYNCLIFGLFFLFFFFFFFSSRRRHTRWTGDWSSDVCSSDLWILQFHAWKPWKFSRVPAHFWSDTGGQISCLTVTLTMAPHRKYQSLFQRSEERRVGKECRSRWAQYQ